MKSLSLYRFRASVVVCVYDFRVWLVSIMPWWCALEVNQCQNWLQSIRACTVNSEEFVCVCMCACVCVCVCERERERERISSSSSSSSSSKRAHGRSHLQRSILLTEQCYWLIITLSYVLSCFVVMRFTGKRIDLQNVLCGETQF
jgi:hypothetical protein